MAGPFAHAASYDRITSRHLGPLDARIVADVAGAGLGPHHRLLDVGTGPGRLPRALAAALPEQRFDAVDLSPEMIEHAREAAGRAGVGDRITFVVGDVSRLPYPDGSFDLIVSSLSQHHWTDVEGAVRELRRVLRPGGRLWIYDVRFALRRATRAARAAFPDGTVRREAIRTWRLPVRIIARLAAQTA